MIKRNCESGNAQLMPHYFIANDPEALGPIRIMCHNYLCRLRRCQLASPTEFAIL